jgi:multicomponent K+:H+ antiporter subunit A
MPLHTLILLPFIGSVIAALLPTKARNAESTLAGVIALLCTVQAALLFPQVKNGGVIREEILWLPSIGINFMVRMDGFSWMFSMLVLGIGSLVVLYARYYMSPEDPVPRFFSFLMAFMGSMSGIVLSGNLIQLAFFWELTSLFSFLLIGYWHHRKDARRGARMALTVTGAGGLALLAGVMVLGHIVGSYDLDVILASRQVIQNDPLYLLALVLILIGALSKSAQFPFHFWLPRAMAAPTPVSAYLHSATMVKAGVFLMARLWPVLSGTPEWFWIVGGAGVITLLLGGYCAMFQDDLKSLLAYSTISHLGLITVLLGFNSSLAAVAAVFHIINHATFKASLFMAAGIIDHESGTRDINRLSGLYRAMPITATLAMVACASMAGVPLLNGFLSKEMFFAEATQFSSSDYLEHVMPLAATLAGMFSVAYSLRFSYDVFFGPLSEDLPRAPHEPSRLMRVPVELLVILCLVVGMLPAISIGQILSAAALPVVGGTLPAYSLAIWHGFNEPLMMSLLALAGGFLLYRILLVQIQRGRFKSPPLLHWIDGQRVFDFSLACISYASWRLRHLLSSNRMQMQAMLLILMVMLAGLAPLWHDGLQPGELPRAPFAPAFAVLWLIGGGAALATAWQAKYHRMAALTFLGTAGLCTCITFVWFSAPDLALTQLAVEVVTTVLILLGLRWLPKRLEIPPQINLWDAIKAKSRRGRDLLISVMAGSGIAALAYAVMTRPFERSISEFFLTRSMPEGGGSNVVNVMLVDFRGFDTFGEIVVLCTVALTVYALLRRFRPARETMDLPLQQRVLPHDLLTDLVNPRNARDTAVGYLMVPAVLVRLVLPLAAVVAVYLFLRGHNEPGGGFVAGLVLSIALLLQYIISGSQWVEAHLQLFPRRWLAIGLLAALLTGSGAWLFGYPFLTSHTAHLQLPILGEMHIASALFFDIGVFSVVVGSTILLLIALAHQSIRGHRQPGKDDGEETEATPPSGHRIMGGL